MVFGKMQNPLKKNYRAFLWTKKRRGHQRLLHCGDVLNRETRFAPNSRYTPRENIQLSFLGCYSNEIRSGSSNPIKISKSDLEAGCAFDL
jgi:hypothetical protein